MIAGALGVGGLATATAAQASTGAATQYGPPPPPTPPAPGFTTVVASVTVCSNGATLGPFDIQGSEDTLTIPPGAFAQCVQVTITAGDLALLAPAVFAGFHIVTTVGVQVDENGAPFPGSFLMPLTMTFRDPGINGSSAVTTWNGASLTVDPAATTAPGVATVTFGSDPAFVVLSPTAVSPTPVPKATVPVTGKPLLGEGILAGSLLAAGLGGLGLNRRRRRARD